MSSPQNSTYVHIAGAATTHITDAPCYLQSVIINTAGTLVTIYDNPGATGKVVAVINGSATGAPGGRFSYNAYCANGLCIVTAGAATDITVTYQ